MPVRMRVLTVPRGCPVWRDFVVAQARMIGEFDDLPLLGSQQREGSLDEAPSSVVALHSSGPSVSAGRRVVASSGSSRSRL